VSVRWHVFIGKGASVSELEKNVVFGGSIMLQYLIKSCHGSSIRGRLSPGIPDNQIFGIKQ